MTDRPDWFISDTVVDETYRRCYSVFRHELKTIRPLMGTELGDYLGPLAGNENRAILHRAIPSGDAFIYVYERGFDTGD